MRYLKIKNKGSLNRLYLFLMGGSDKRGVVDDLSIIGEKGSGLKLAIIGALKLGLRVIFTSVDQAGPYTMVPTVRPVVVDNHTFNQIFYEYIREGQIKLPTWWERLLGKKPLVGTMVEIEKVVETPYMLESFKDYTEPVGDDDKKIFKVFRELVANAHDADKQFILSAVSPSDITSASLNEVIVYLEITKELIKLLSTKERAKYFKIFKDCPEPLCGDAERGFIYSKSDPIQTRLFVRGVVSGVSTAEENTSCFDYSFPHQYLLAEDKTIKDIDTYRFRVGMFLQTLDSVYLAKRIIAQMAINFANFENSALQWVQSDVSLPEPVRQAYCQAWWEIFGKDKVILPGTKTELDHSAEQSGYNIATMKMSVGTMRLLKACGVLTSNNIVPMQGEMGFTPASIDELSTEYRANYETGVRLMHHYFPGFKDIPHRLVKREDKYSKYVEVRAYAGELETEYKEMCFNIKHFDSLRNALLMMVHEYRHCKSKAKDLTKAFDKAADEQAVDLIFRNEIEHNRHVKAKSP